jgi:hypothetical protein
MRHPAHLLLHLATSVDCVARLDPGVLGYLRGPGRDALTQLVPAVACALERRGPLVVVFDDTHEVTAPASVDVLRALIDVIPSATTVALLGRCPPPLDLTRHRLGCNVVDIGVEQLRLSDDEALAVFKAAGGPHDGVHWPRAPPCSGTASWPGRPRCCRMPNCWRTTWRQRTGPANANPTRSGCGAASNGCARCRRAGNGTR